MRMTLQSLCLFAALMIGQSESDPSVPAVPSGTTIETKVERTTHPELPVLLNQAPRLALPALPRPESEGPIPRDTPPIQAPERWAFMKLLQGSGPGDCLDSQHVQISGWTEVSYTASSDRLSNLPMGFNYLANDFLLQQNWL